MADRLDTPTERKFKFFRRRSSGDGFGQFAEATARFMGSPKFILYMTDRVQAEQDRQRAERNLADTEYLTREIAGLRLALQDVATRDFVRSELRDMLNDLREELEERDERFAQLSAQGNPDQAEDSADLSTPHHADS